MEILKLTEKDFERVAQLLGVEVAVVKAVQEVETGGRGGFYSSGRPRILFEGHVFWERLEKRKIDPTTLVAGNENILYKKWTREHYLKGEREYERLEKAMKINEEAALESASWGMFQIMGYNYAICNYRNVRDYVDAMKKSETAQLEAFAAYVKGNKQLAYLANQDWKGFARRYNGLCYADNHYDTKLEQAYLKYV